MTMRRAHFRRLRLSIVLFPAEDLSLRGSGALSIRYWLRAAHQELHVVSSGSKWEARARRKTSDAHLYSTCGPRRR